jgi:hypothetical protein
MWHESIDPFIHDQTIFVWYTRENKQIKKFSNIGQSKTKTIVILDEDPSKEHITCAQ